MLTMADLDEMLVEANAHSAEMKAEFERQFYRPGMRASMTRAVSANPMLTAALPVNEKSMVERRLKRLSEKARLQGGV